MPTFILNDETKINSYGFRVLNNGGSFARFDSNPVMLDSHNNTIQTVLGSWQNRRLESSNLLADTNFDSEDLTVKPIEEKVNRGFIKGASMGILFEPECMKLGADGVWELAQWELMEASICAVPSNAGSISLFSKRGLLLTANEVNLSLGQLGLKPFKPALNNNNFSMVLTVDDFEKLSDTDKMNFATNHRLAYSQLFGSSKMLVNDVVKTQLDFHLNQLNRKLVGQPVSYSLEQVKTIDDFEKLSDASKLDFKNKHNSAYKALFSRLN